MMSPLHLLWISSLWFGLVLSEKELEDTLGFEDENLIQQDGGIQSVLHDLEIAEEQSKARRLEEIKNDVRNNLHEIIQEGHQRALELMESQKKAKQLSPKSFQGRTSIAAHFHGRTFEPESKHMSDCFAQRFMEAAKIIVVKYKLSQDESDTLLRSIMIPEEITREIKEGCQAKALRLGFRTTPPDCTSNLHDKYRSYNGACNNKANAAWGMAGIKFERLLDAKYEPGNEPRVNDIDGNPLPGPRSISAGLSEGGMRQNDPQKITQMLKAWGQFLDHDIVMTPESEVTECCKDGKKATNPATANGCIEIDVSEDAIFKPHGVECLGLKRSLAAPNSAALVREQLNQITAFIDGSNVYGSTEEKAMKLRTLQGGKLKTNALAEKTNCDSPCSYSFLPYSKDLAGETSDEDAPFVAGDARVNEQPGLTSMHTMFLRFHNLLADKLAANGVATNDETLYQETRRIVGAIMQHITYTEFLPTLFGRRQTNRKPLYTPEYYDKYYYKYDDSVNPSVFNVFGAAAYRMGHSLISDKMKAKTIEFDLAGMFFNNKVMITNARFPSYILEGECTLKSEQIDVFLVDTLRNKLFTKGTESHGHDLMSLNIQRGREHGLPLYTEWRKYCKLKDISSFDDLKTEMPENVVQKLKTLYGKVENIDLFPAGLAENRVSGGFVGPTFLCILKEQFTNLKYGDRFWYENKNTGFTGNAMRYLKQTTLSAILCETTTIERIQRYTMLTWDHPTINVPESCEDIKRKHSILGSQEIKTMAKHVITRIG